MAIKDLAVAYNASVNADVAVSVATQICAKYQATLTGLYVDTPIRIERHLAHQLGRGVLENFRQVQLEASKEIEARFRGRIAEIGFEGAVEWISREGRPNALLARLARHYDLMVMGQFSSPSDSDRPVRAEELVVLSSAPLVIVPNGYHVRPLVEHAVVAWDGSRPAARALADALQILESNKRLDVLTVSADGNRKGEGETSLPSVITHLQRHGIDAQPVTLSASRDGVGETIIEYCRAGDPDALIMGAYGHAPLREDLFGGVTKTILQHSSVPVFMAH